MTSDLTNLNEMVIEWISIRKIKAYSANAKKHPETQVANIAQSIKDFGWKQPLVIDKKNVIVIGHGRFQAAKLLKLKSVPCVVTDLNEEECKRLRILDNKLNESDWDIDFLKSDIQDLNFDDYDLNFGIVDIEISDDAEVLVQGINKRILRCPCCGHINEEKAFKTYADTE